MKKKTNEKFYNKMKPWPCKMHTSAPNPAFPSASTLNPPVFYLTLILSAVIRQIQPRWPPARTSRIFIFRLTRLILARDRKQEVQTGRANLAINDMRISIDLDRAKEVRIHRIATATRGEIGTIRVPRGDIVGKSIDAQKSRAGGCNGVVGWEGRGELAPVGTSGDVGELD